MIGEQEEVVLGKVEEKRKGQEEDIQSPTIVMNSLTNLNISARELKKLILANKIDVNSLIIPWERLKYVNREAVTEETLRTIIKQLGYLPYNLIEVAAFDRDTAHPTVLKLYPLNFNDLNGRYNPTEEERLPFPTMFWMCCPNIARRVAHIEENGFVVKFKENFHCDSFGSSNTEAMKRAHSLYAEERWSSLSEEDREFISRKGWLDVLKTSGVAGLTEPTAVKCLHTHYAHYLARPQHGNIIGSWVNEQLQQEEKADTNRR